jgi:glycerol-3-phosphate dehydrogenase
MALVDWAVDKEEAHTVSDVMTRRTQLYFRDTEQGLPAVDKVAARMQSLLDWSDEECAFFSEDYRQEVALSRQWRGEYQAAVASNEAAVLASTSAAGAGAVHA